MNDNLKKAPLANHYIANPKLPKIELPFEWKGTPLNKNGQFLNHEFLHDHSLSKLLKWQTMKNPQKLDKKQDDWKLEVLFNTDFLTSKNDCIVWLGHATYFIRLAGISILVDPVLFNVSFLKRKSPLPIAPDLLTGLDYILISHDHRDHLDVKSIQILSKINPKATYLTGLRMDALLQKITGSTMIQSAGWYQKFITKEDIEIYYIPSRHWAKRSLADTNHRLWGGFIIQAVGKTIYFGGDSGYGSHFSDIAQIFPRIDCAILGIGAYKPEFFMGQSHLSPSEAVKAFHDLKAKTLIPMHYGTFDLSDEPLSDPFKTLHKIEHQQGIKGSVAFLNPGEMLLTL